MYPDLSLARVRVSLTDTTINLINSREIKTEGYTEVCPALLCHLGYGRLNIYLGSGDDYVQGVPKRCLCLWAISNETVAGIEISFKEKDTKYLEFLFVYYMDDLIREDHDWELFDPLSPRKRRNIINLKMIATQ
ncbi:hypothetical protein F8388_002739 [Cannabis sativa]|uniref:Ycf2 N-terminal domain-containing protein n=1 Tax=Cannabis sativa TaxID=3483 RepID=A0A7J6F7P0_CANSA|nr:hypothetical protein F8388_002739 [Cannabis sativa]